MQYILNFVFILHKVTIFKIRRSSIFDDGFLFRLFIKKFTYCRFLKFIMSLPLVTACPHFLIDYIVSLYLMHAKFKMAQKNCKRLLYSLLLLLLESFDLNGFFNRFLLSAAYFSRNRFTENYITLDEKLISVLN